MDNIIPTNEYTEFEDRRYANPELYVDETNKFIDQLRSTQVNQNQEIAKQTYNLGTRVPSSIGGLGTNTTNGLSYFTSRYQTPQTNSAVNNLRAAARASALNQALTNEQQRWQKRYNDALRSQQLRANTSPTGGGGYPATKGNVITEDTGDIGKSILDGGIISNPAGRPSFVPDDAIETTYSEGGNVYTTYVDPATGRVYAKYENGNLVSSSPSPAATDVGRKVSLYYPQTARGVGPAGGNL